MTLTSELDAPGAVATWHRRGAAHVVGNVVVLAGATIVTDSVTPSSIAVLVGALVLAAAAAGVLSLTGTDQYRWSLLIWPVVVCLSIGVLDVVAAPAADLLMGLLVLAFLFIGVTQPPTWGLWFVIPIGAVYVRVVDFDLRELYVRLPIAAAVWIICSEVPARLVRELHRKNAILVELATTDSMTGLLNRARLDVHLEMAGPSGAVALIDLDHFKDFNDEHGHVAGDVALMDFATALRTATRPQDTVFRYGGEEFLIVLTDTRPEEAARVVHRLRSAWSGHGSGLTFSAGVTFGGRAAVHAADTLLYQAKAKGRDCVLVDTECHEPGPG